MSLSFLPVNLSRTAQRDGFKPTLVRVDEDARPQLLRWKWLMNAKHEVYRLTGQRTNGQFAYSPIKLQDVVEKGVNSVFMNGDVLDFRGENLMPVVFSPAKAPDVAPGSTFKHLPEYAAAVKEVAQRLPYYIAESHTWRAQLSLAELSVVLDWVRDNCRDMHMDDTNSAVWAHFKNNAPKLERPYTRAHLRQLIAGTSSHIPGYNYDALKASRKIGCGRPHHYGE